MSEVAETYLVISLLMAVFAAVAAVGTALVLGVGFERLRNGFEIVRKQTAFFSEAIHKLDEKADNLNGRTNALEAEASLIGKRTVSLEEQHNELVDEINKRTLVKTERTEDLRRAEEMSSKVDDMMRRVREYQSRNIGRKPVQDNSFSFSMSYPSGYAMSSLEELDMGEVRIN